MLTKLEQVREFHTVFEHPISDEPYITVFDEQPKLVQLRYDLLYEEIKEFVDAYENHNIVEMVDALCDILYVSYGAALVFGLDIPQTGASLEYDGFNPYILIQHRDYYFNCIRDFSNYLKLYKIAVSEKDINKIKNALTDINFMCHLLSFTLNINIDKAFDLVHKSNMTKACKNGQEAGETVNYIRDTQPQYKEPRYKQSKCGKYWIVYNAENNKILKSKYYTPVNLQYVKQKI